MTDIVEVIRPRSEGEAAVMISAAKLHRAADEIERLRVQVITLLDHIEDNAKRGERLANGHRELLKTSVSDMKKRVENFGRIRAESVEKLSDKDDPNVPSCPPIDQHGHRIETSNSDKGKSDD